MVENDNLSPDGNSKVSENEDVIPDDDECPASKVSGNADVIVDDDKCSVFTDSQESLKSAFESELRSAYINKQLSCNHRGWKTRNEIDELSAKIKSRNAFEEAKLLRQGKIKRVINSKDYVNLPKEIKRLWEEAHANGGFRYNRNLWSLRTDDEDGKEYLYKDKSKQTNLASDYHKMIPIEDSYEPLMKMHIELGHIAGRGLFEHCTAMKLGCFPRNLVFDVNKFCSHCLSIKKTKDVVKRNTPKSMRIEDSGMGQVIAGTFSIKTNSVIADDTTVLIALYQKSSYVSCAIIENDYSMKSYSAHLMSSLLHAGVPSDMFLWNCTVEEKEEVRLYGQCCNLFVQC